MSTFALTNIAAQSSRAVHATQKTRIQHQFRRRWVHNSLRKQAIMMPALSPFATEGTITRWKVKEGEAFKPGDILLQIENDVGICDVEACSPGIMGKILTPDGTDHVPVEAVIAIVARDATELASIQSQSMAPTPPPFLHTPQPPSTTLHMPSGSASSPRLPEFKVPPMLASPRTPRTPSLFEMHTMGYGQRSAHVGGPRGVIPSTPSSAFRLDLPPRSPKPQHQPEEASAEPATHLTGLQTPLSANIPISKSQNSAAEDVLVDAAALRRKIVANLSGTTRKYPDEDQDLA